MNTDNNQGETLEKDEDRDLSTGESDTHPVGTGVGVAGGAAAGAAIGGVGGGPVGMAVGGVIGAVVGGLAGHDIAEHVDPKVEDAYWSENYQDEPYYDEDYDFEDYQPAYRSGYQSYTKYRGSSFEDTEHEQSRDWEANRGDSRLEWDEAKHAAKAGWHRVHRSQPDDDRIITER